jgi:hypothetical protein
MEGKLTGEVHTNVKALFPFDGKTVIEGTLETLRATGRIRRMVVVGPQEVAVQTRHLADAALPETDSGAGNVLRGMEWLGAAADGRPPARVLVITTDLPFLNREALTGFLDACPPAADLCVPVIERREFEARFGQTHTRYVRLRDGQWMIGCAFLLNPRAILRNRPLVERVFAARRSQLGMARLLGARFVLRLLIGRLSLPEVEAKCLSLLGCRGAGIRGCAAELGFDLDYPEDYRYAIQRVWCG